MYGCYSVFQGWTAGFRGVEDQAGPGARAVLWHSGQVLFDYTLPPSVSPPLSVFCNMPLFFLKEDVNKR